jgi:hypothetical protein
MTPKEDIAMVNVLPNMQRKEDVVGVRLNRNVGHGSFSTQIVFVMENLHRRLHYLTSTPSRV